MKTNYLLKSNRERRKSFKALLPVFFILLVGAVFYFFLPALGSRAVFAVARPIWSLRDFLGQNFSSAALLFKTKSSLLSENAALREELRSARLSLLTLEHYRSENAELKALFGRENDEKRILAAVVARPGDSLYDSFVIDVGAKDGVAKGDKARVGDFIVGEVAEAFGEYSKVEIFSSPGKTFEARLGESGYKAEAKGRGGGNFSAMLLKTLRIRRGDLVRFPGISGKFYGVVGDVESNPADVFQKVLFALPVNIHEIKWLEILK